MSPSAPPKKNICGTCGKGFSTKSATRSHARSKHAKSDAQQAAPSAPATSLRHRGITYSLLSDVEQNETKSLLSSLCHSEERLQKEGYHLPQCHEMGSEAPLASKSNLPDPDPLAPKVTAIVLDCEMAGTEQGENELIQFTMVDFLSGKVLLSSLVDPSRPVADWREDITGMNALRMQQAVLNNETLHGWEAARAELWRLADKETILIGQSILYDLQVLHTSHARIIDSAILTADAVFNKKKSSFRKRWGLETLCDELLNIRIRSPSEPGGRATHDALEDALAAREIVLLCARQPQKLRRWAYSTRVTFFTGRSAQQLSPPTRNSRPRTTFKRRSTVDEEPLTFRDIVDWEMWPKSPPDSD